mgnify:CR=1 FL=1
MDTREHRYSIMSKEIMKEKCVECDQETPYDVSTHISLRQCYVEGAGQLCQECWTNIYEERKCQNQ